MFRFSFVDTINNQAQRIKELEQALKLLAYRHDDKVAFPGSRFACKCAGHRKAETLLNEVK